MRTHRRTVPLLTALLALGSLPATAQVVEDSARESRYRRLRTPTSLVPLPLPTLAYTPDGRSLYYSRAQGDTIATYALDLGSGQVQPLFDTGRLRAALLEAVGTAADVAGTPFPRFGFGDKSGEQIAFTLAGRRWTLDLQSYAVAPLETGATNGAHPGVILAGELGRPDLREVLSPDGTRIATLTEHDAAVREVASGATGQITFDGTPDYYWGYPGIARETWAWWSPDGAMLALRKVDMDAVGSFPLVRWLETPPRVDWIRSVHNVRVGATLPREELHVWHEDSGQLVRLDTGDPGDVFLYVLGWRADSSELIVLRVTRDYRSLDILALDPDSGAARTVLSERFATCWLEQAWAPPLRRYWPLTDGDRFLWKSESGGWNHLFLRNFEDETVTQLTSGPYEVDDVIGIDEDAGWVYFSARTDPLRPYDVHIHRVRLDGSGLTRLTEGPGRHAAELVSGSEYIEVWHRQIDAPTEIRIRRSNGDLVRTLATANYARLREAGWTPPEEFTVKAADGTADLWGVMYKPADFDPAVRYPVVEFIYGGPVLEYVPRQFPYWMFPQALAQLGYVVIQLDARGTPGRGREFLEAGFDRASVVIADHAGAIRQLAERHEYLDPDRVGIVGQSWGGDFTTQALLRAPDVYRAGVAVSGGWWSNPELSEAKATVFEQCAVLREDEPAPSLGSLEGDLLVIHGTADLNMSGSADLMWWLDSVIDAGKYVDLMVLPDRPHDVLQTDPYVQGAVRRYFDEHLKPGA